MDVNFPYLVRTTGGNALVAGFIALIDAQQWVALQGGARLYYVEHAGGFEAGAL